MLRFLFRVFGSKNTGVLRRFYQRSRAARITFICIALATQVLALLLTGILGILLGAFVRTILS